MEDNIKIVLKETG